MLIDTFVNAIFLYDDKMEITYNYHEGTTTVTFEDLQKTIKDQGFGSDMDSVGAANGTKIVIRFFPRIRWKSCGITGGRTDPIIRMVCFFPAGEIFRPLRRKR